MGLIRAGIGVAKAAINKESAGNIAKAGVKGLLPRVAGGLVDKVMTPDNIGRAQSGIQTVIDNGRGGTFKQETNRMPPPPGSTTLSTPPVANKMPPIPGSTLSNPSAGIRKMPPPPTSKGK